MLGWAEPAIDPELRGMLLKAVSCYPEVPFPLQNSTSGRSGAKSTSALQPRVPQWHIMTVTMTLEKPTLMGNACS